ncbi:hypothetical protein H6F86_02120 [Phormidium sp. FACHB-592]|uniref:HpsJ family protein n=1 Tax=Stenomitos frigidus AS-A4 TaxID=2933935 RepID=A0ABV0KK11_9CYAN|nr:HpsJ family protein [Phormidium sp. FACHB-592]MBD2072702.1 hypothetical protein [Phormidium sp. FACHB-592]
MATTSVPQNFAAPYSAKPLCRLVGIACLIGFIVDILILALPPALNSAEWRVGFLQQMSDRSIILLFGTALLLYSSLDYRAWRKQLAMLCLILGVVFQLSCILVIRDSFSLNDIAIKNINVQASQVQSQIESAKTNPKATPAITPEQLDKASQLVNTRAGSLKENAKTGILKTGVAIVGNLVVVGFALIGLGRYGLRPRKS